jgi:biopolymer transport protein ExbD
VELKADRGILLDGQKVRQEDLRDNLGKKAESVPKEKLRIHPYWFARLSRTREFVEVSLLDVLITTEPNVRYEAVSHVLEVCGVLGIRRTYFIHPDVREGKEVKLWIPTAYTSWRTPRIEAEKMVEKPIILLEEVEIIEQDNEKQEKRQKKKDKPETTPETPGDSRAPAPDSQPHADKHTATAAHTFCETRIKLQWAHPNNPRKILPGGEDAEGTKGMLVLKVKDRLLMKDNKPDWEGLEKLLKRYVENFMPTKSYKALPITIDSMRKVHFADVLRCIVLCQKAGIGEILLVIPEIPY